MRFIPKLSFAALIVVFAFSAFAQKTDEKKKKNSENRYPQSGPVIVKGNLLVLDAENKYVDGITQENVKFFEDGVEQKITSLVRKDPPLQVGLVVDNSGSLRPEIGGLLQASRFVVTNLQDGDAAFIVRFVSSDIVQLVQERTTDKRDLFKTIDNFYVEGGQSAIIDALYLASEKISESEKTAPRQRFAIVLLTDGEERSSYFDFDQLQKRLDQSDVQVFPLFFTGSLTDNFSSSIKSKHGKSNAIRLAQTLALRTGGIASFIDSKVTDDALLSALKPIMIELRSQYVFTYTPTNQKRDGLARKLTVQIADGPAGVKRTGHIRESFVVPLD